MPLELQLTLTDEQLDQLADRIATKMGKVVENPLTISQFAKSVGKSWPYIKGLVDAGIIVKINRPGDIQIPYSELVRYRTGAPPKK